MKNYLVPIAALLLFASCKKVYEAPVPDNDWAAFNAPTAVKLSNNAGRLLEGIYTIGEGAGTFGADAAAKWSFTVNGTDTTYHLSFFCQKDITYIIAEGRRVDTSILLSGYWRRMVGDQTGLVRLTIGRAAGAGRLLQNLPPAPGDTIGLSGVFGAGSATPDLPLQLRFARPLYNARPLEIVAHRGGGRTADLLPASENSVELIKMASRFGATGVEIDVRLTSDGVPVLFHDATLNERLIQKAGLVGPIENYSYAQLSSLVRLIKGERIPTLREAMNAVVYATPIRYIWLDTKYNGSMQVLRDFQVEFTQKAIANGRPVTITIGIPDEEVLTAFKALPNFQNIPSVNELTLTDVGATNSAIWAPRFTLGLQNTEVAGVQAQGRRAFVWTLDVPDNIRSYLYDGRFDGVLSNYPSAVAYYYYAKQ